MMGVNDQNIHISLKLYFFKKNYFKILLQYNDKILKLNFS